MREVFLSYHHYDKKLAAEAKAELERSGLSGFLAHEDIEVTKLWRDEILKHLDSCSALMAIVTEHFASSVWVNQEVGIAIGKGKPIVSLIFAGSQALPAFLEMFQGVDASAGIGEAIKSTLEIIAASPEAATTQSPGPDIILETKDMKLRKVPWGNVTTTHAVEFFNRGDLKGSLSSVTLQIQQVPEMRISSSRLGQVRFPIQIEPKNPEALLYQITFNADLNAIPPPLLSVDVQVVFEVWTTNGREVRSGNFKIIAP